MCGSITKKSSGCWTRAEIAARGCWEGDRSIKDTCQISGKIGDYFYSLAADWPEKSFYVIDSSVLPGRQIMIYIPRDAGQQLGEPFTVAGRLFSAYTGEYSEISAMDVDDLGVKTLHMVDPVFLEGESK